MSSTDGIRNSKRVPVKLETGIVSGGSEHTGFIDNVSERGLNIIVITPACVNTFIPGAKLELKFQPAEEGISLDCEIRRVEINRHPPDNLIYSLALEIAEQPQEYRKFFKKLK